MLRFYVISTIDLYDDADIEVYIKEVMAINEEVNIEELKA